MSEKKIQVGIVGAGFIGPAHIEALRRLSNVEVVAISARNEEKADRKALELEIPNAYGSYEVMIESAPIESVHVCVPNYLHFPVVKKLFGENDE